MSVVGRVSSAQSLFGVLAASLVVMLALAPLRAQESSELVAFQARLTQNGFPLNGDLELTFELHSDQSGTAEVWSETRTVAVRNGVLSVYLGEVTPLGLSFGQAATQSSRYVAVRAANGDEIVVPRVKLAAVPYALSAARAAGLADGETGVVTLESLDERYVATDGEGGGVVRRVNGVEPAPDGNFTITRGPSENVVITPTASGIEIEVENAGGGLDVGTADDRYVNKSGDEVHGGLGVGGLLDITGSRIYVREAASTAEVVFWMSDSHAARIRSTGALSVEANGDITLSSQRVVVPSALAPTRITPLTSFLQIARDPSGPLTVDVGGHLSAQTISAQMKNFVVDHPLDPTKEIVYCSLEGPGCDLFVRGTAVLVAGTVSIDLPEHFAVLARPGSITVQVTPTEDCEGLYVVERTPERIGVRERRGGTSGAGFDYLVIGARNHEDHPVIRDKKD